MQSPCTKIEDAWLRRMGPAHFGHINFRGIFSFVVEPYAQALIRQGMPDPQIRSRYR